MLVVPQTAGKDGTAKLAALRPGRYSAVKLKGADGLIGAAAGESAGFYLKIMTMAPDLSQVQPVLHLADPAQRALRDRGLRGAARRRPRRGSAREVHRRQPAAGDLR